MKGDSKELGENSPLREIEGKKRSLEREMKMMK